MSNGTMLGPWVVFVDDNFHFMDVEERYTLGSFASYDAAVEACMRVVDASLGSASGQTADTLFTAYTTFGEDPWIKGPAPPEGVVRFSAWDYARRRCHELAAAGS